MLQKTSLTTVQAIMIIVHPSGEVDKSTMFKLEANNVWFI